MDKASKEHGALHGPRAQNQTPLKTACSVANPEEPTRSAVWRSRQKETSRVQRDGISPQTGLTIQGERRETTMRETS